MPTASNADPPGTRRFSASASAGASFVPFVAAALLGLAVGDAFRPPDRQATARAAVAAIDAYRRVISPRLAATGIVRCRFTPTCSAYGREAIARYGSPKGFALALGRIVRCHPWAEGGADPVP
jgi:putative membrane protein insertion efficiency factor